MGVLSGPSGVGKDTVIDAWAKVNPLVVRVVTYTTREPRDGEKDGRDYNFVDAQRFAELQEKGWFWESKCVHGNMYASPKADTERLLEQGMVPVLKIDVQGAIEVMRIRPDAITVFILPPSTEELERRIRGRGSDDDATIRERLVNARRELALAGRYQHQIVNDDINQVVEKLERMLR
ncbi:MAG: guanylate kinase [Armatimonadetes bacterium]|nr:guanylate kinase [Armatimonadota bacterium]